MCHMRLVMSTGFHAELHRRRCGVVVRSRCQDMEARAAGGLGWGNRCNGERWEAILSRKSHILTMDTVISQDHLHRSCWGLASLGHGYFVPCLTGDRCCIVGSSDVGVHEILALGLMRLLQSCWVDTTDRLTVKRQILSLVRSHCSSSYLDTSRVWGTIPQELLLAIALPHLLFKESGIILCFEPICQTIYWSFMSQVDITFRCVQNKGIYLSISSYIILSEWVASTLLSIQVDSPILQAPPSPKVAKERDGASADDPGYPAAATREEITVDISEKENMQRIVR